jgi:hypothetical protein
MLVIQTLGSATALAWGAWLLGLLPDANLPGGRVTWKHAAAGTLYIGGLYGIINAVGFHRMAESFRAFLG